MTIRRTVDAKSGIEPSDVPILSFFTGAGLLDLGFMKAGFPVIWHNECNPWFIAGFEHAMAGMAKEPYEKAIQDVSSVVDLGPNCILREAFNGVRPPGVYGIIGGPPCPDFSVAGKNGGRHGEHGKLSQVFVSRIIDLQPTFFLYENVPGLLSTEKHRRFLFHLRQQLLDDYAVSLRVLNALDFGVPQDRRRVFLVGFRRKWLKKALGVRFALDSDTWFPWPHDPRFVDAKRRFEWPGQSPFGSTPPKPTGIPEELMVGNLICHRESIASLPNGLEGFRPKSSKFKIIAEGDVSRKSFKRLHRWRYSPAASYGNNEVHLHPIEPRRLTVREAMRIQSVPDSYALPAEMPLSHKFKTISNGVPVNLATVVAESIASVLKGEMNGI
jgi:DNA (cytosine-5)-methyltransferase 1